MELNFTPKHNAIVEEIIRRPRKDDDANPFSGFEEEGDYQFLKEMKELIEKEAQFDEVDEENIKQWLENDAEIPGHKICSEAEGEED